MWGGQASVMPLLQRVFAAAVEQEDWAAYSSGARAFRLFVRRAKLTNLSQLRPRQYREQVHMHLPRRSSSNS